VPTAKLDAEVGLVVTSANVRVANVEVAVASPSASRADVDSDRDGELATAPRVAGCGVVALGRVR
jgi:hypothetical protein